MEIRYDRLIYSISSLFLSYYFFNRFIFIEKNIILGIIISMILLIHAIMFLDYSMIFKKKINKNYNFNKYFDITGIITVLYLFIKAIT